MKIFLTIFIITCSNLLFGQNEARVKTQKTFDEQVAQIEKDTDSKFETGPLFYFNEPYKAVFTSDVSLMKSGTITTNFNYEKKAFKTGDTIIVIASAPIGSLKKIKPIGSNDIYETKSYGRSGFKIIDKEGYKAQMSKIKAADWKKIQLLGSLLSCGSLESSGYKNFEKHHIIFGDTQVFFQVRGEDSSIHLKFMLSTYGGEDFKNLGPALANTSFVEFTFLNEETLQLKCIGLEANNDFAVLDITKHIALFQQGIKEIKFSLTKTTEKKELKSEDIYSIGIKLDCIKL